MTPSCSNCNAFLQQSPDGGLCRARPPSVFLTILQPPPLTPMERQLLGGRTPQPQQQTTAYFPPMMKEGWCRDWQASDAVKN